ncbi:hypothetical protein DIURU_003841 [Diutina rugosa]|uniref:Vacuolar calcium ion transporter n=1 Tax=Diutina rugosa TaxID=5481 RepID=A0A642UK45_DIURU|nr:uncharacterized protein DIURU_003841 [Diutina rugosa]KAA8900418.1 hypothetical protein DIURU_003841 [Diutina rugosa]
MVDESSPYVCARRPVQSWSQVIESTLKSSPVNWLLVFVPFGIIAGYMNWSSTAIFWLNFFAIIPLASVLAYSTEELADTAGETLGGLLNATFGNAVELIVSIIALRDGQVRIVQASMLGSMLSNLLLVLGCCFIAGGLTRERQRFNLTAAQTMTSLMALSVAGLFIPAAFHSSLGLPEKPADPPMGTSGKHQDGNDLILSLSRGTAIIMLIVYCLFLLFQLKTHKKLFEAETTGDIHLTEEPSGPVEPQMTTWQSITVLVVSTVIISFCADYMVSSIDDIVERSGLSKTFIGLILIPIVGNAAEHVTAIVVAMKDKMDLAITVAVGSSIQIALFVTPFMVLVGWMINVPMSLYYSTFETAVAFVAVFITALVLNDGESNWLEGAMLFSTYVIIAISFFYYPDVKG